jgi:hypothetical protein
MGFVAVAPVVAVALAVGFAPAPAAAAPQDVTSTNTYLTAGYAALRAAIANMHVVGANVDELNRRYAAECPKVGAGSPQNEAADPMTYEVAGALWSTAYHTDESIVRAFVRAVKPLRWSNAKITRNADSYAASLADLAALPLPDLCGDVRTWSLGGFAAIPTTTTQFDQRVESIEGHPIPLRLLAPYEGAADRALAARVARLENELDSMETMLGQEWWDMTLETLALNQ